MASSTTDYENIVRHCLKTETLWEDPEFPAVQSSVFYHQTPPFTFQWKRPHVSRLHILKLMPCPSARTQYFLSWTK